MVQSQRSCSFIAAVEGQPRTTQAGGRGPAGTGGRAFSLIVGGPFFGPRAVTPVANSLSFFLSARLPHRIVQPYGLVYTCLHMVYT